MNNRRAAKRRSFSEITTTNTLGMNTNTITRIEAQPPAANRIQGTPCRLTSPGPERERFERELLRIAIEEALRAQKPPLRRSQLIQRDYRPEPVAVTEIKRPWFGPIVSLAQRLILPLSLVALLALMWAGGRWIDRHTQYGVLDTEALRPKSVAQVQREQYYALPSLPAPWHWECLPFSLSIDAKGRPSFWVAVRLRGVIRSQDDLPKSAEIGDEYVLADRSVGWVWMVPSGAKAASWVDP
jgi:hypothetical protein